MELQGKFALVLIFWAKSVLVSCLFVCVFVCFWVVLLCYLYSFNTIKIVFKTDPRPSHYHYRKHGQRYKHHWSTFWNFSWSFWSFKKWIRSSEESRASPFWYLYCVLTFHALFLEEYHVINRFRSSNLMWHFVHNCFQMNNFLITWRNFMKDLIPRKRRKGLRTQQLPQSQRRPQRLQLKWCPSFFIEFFCNSTHIHVE